MVSKEWCILLNKAEMQTLNFENTMSLRNKSNQTISVKKPFKLVLVSTLLSQRKSG